MALGGETITVTSESQLNCFLYPKYLSLYSQISVAFTPHPEISLVYRQDFWLGDSAGGKMDLWPGLHQGPEKASWMLGMCLLE